MMAMVVFHKSVVSNWVILLSFVQNPIIIYKSIERTMFFLNLDTIGS